MKNTKLIANLLASVFIAMSNKEMIAALEPYDAAEKILIAVVEIERAVANSVHTKEPILSEWELAVREFAKWLRSESE